MRILRESKGETIVEVMLALAVLGLVITFSFISTNKSSRGARSAQERAEATRHAESQLEQLKAAVDSGSPSAPDFALPFCYEYNTGVLRTAVTASSRCKVGLGNLYETVVEPVSLVGGIRTVKVTVFWPGLSTNAVDNVTIFYKLGP